MEEAAKLYDAAAEELDQAVAHCRTAARHFRDGVVPPTINLHNPGPDCDLDYVPNTARKMKVDVALSNSFGFGGTNGSVIFRRFNG